MSSIVVVIRAVVMLGCLVAVPVLAVTHPAAVMRARQAGAQLLDRLSTDPATVASSARPVRKERSALPTSEVVGGDENGGCVTPTQVHRSVQLLPEPVAEEPPLPLVTPVASIHHVPRVEPARTSSGGPDASADVADPAAVDQWQQSAAILQELGAVEYTLEKWGKSGRLYRFRCRVSVEDAHSYHRHFEAVDADGGQAVEEVVRQVRAWRNANASVR